jgi:LmbE family N-acetylglucosaminyl deacetylase
MNLVKKVCIIAAHPDDETIGMGGTISRMTNSGHEVSVLILSDGVSSREQLREPVASRKAASKAALDKLGVHEIDFLNFPDNKFDSIPLLEIVREIEVFLDKHTPDYVFSNYSHDLNVDHQITASATLTACRPTAGRSIRGVFQYQTLSSTEWNFGAEKFSPSLYVDISDTLSKKLAALNEYQAELNPFPHPRSIVAIEALATLVGSECGYQRAESFVQKYLLL